MRISVLAKQADITPDTIRFYEKMGLLDESHFSRQENNYRDYHEISARPSRADPLRAGSGFQARRDGRRFACLGK